MRKLSIPINTLHTLPPSLRLRLRRRIVRMVRIKRKREQYTNSAPDKRQHRNRHVKIVDAPSSVTCRVDVAAEYEPVQTPSYYESDAYSSRC
jgi:hypothetical protein